MTAKSLPQLRAELYAAEAAYRDALNQYFAAHVNRHAPDRLAAHVAACRACGAALDAALTALIDALWFPLNDSAQTAEQLRLHERRALLAEERRLLS